MPFNKNYQLLEIAASGDVCSGSWSCENALAEALTRRDFA
jgi:hypothetical protein